MANSITTFGFVVPIVTDKNGVIVCGHGRYFAALDLGLETVPTICADHLTDAQVRALRIADNRLAELSEWDDDNLRIELGDLATDCFYCIIKDIIDLLPPIIPPGCAGTGRKLAVLLGITARIPERSRAPKSRRRQCRANETQHNPARANLDPTGHQMHRSDTET
jgi:hypothetical protein